MTLWVIVDLDLDLDLDLAVPSALSTTMAMFPFWDPSRQENLFLIHRCCVLPLAAAGLFFAYFALVSWLAGSAD